MLSFLHRHIRVTDNVASVLRSVVRRIVVRSDAFEIYLHRPEGEAEADTVAEPTIIPWQRKSRRPEAGIVFVPSVTTAGQDHLARQGLIEGVAKARIWVGQLADGKCLADIARDYGRTEHQIRSLLNLAFLSPGKVKALLDGLGPIGTAISLAKNPPMIWPEASHLSGICPDLS